MSPLVKELRTVTDPEELKAFRASHTVFEDMEINDVYAANDGEVVLGRTTRKPVAYIAEVPGGNFHVMYTDLYIAYDLLSSTFTNSYIVISTRD